MGNENGFAIQKWYYRVRIEPITKHKDTICVLRYTQTALLIASCFSFIREQSFVEFCLNSKVPLFFINILSDFDWLDFAPTWVNFIQWESFYQIQNGNQNVHPMCTRSVQGRLRFATSEIGYVYDISHNENGLPQGCSNFNNNLRYEDKSDLKEADCDKSLVKDTG